MKAEGVWWEEMARENIEWNKMEETFTAHDRMIPAGDLSLIQ